MSNFNRFKNLADARSHEGTHPHLTAFQEEKSLPGRKIDLTGQVLSLLALASLITVLIEGGNWGWLSPGILGLSASFFLSSLLFFVVETRQSDPMLPLTLFRSAQFSVATSLGLLLLGIGAGVPLILPPVTSVLLASVDRSQVGLASATLNAGRQVGAAAGVAVLGSLLSANHPFVAGFRIAMIVSGVSYIVGTLLALRFIPPPTYQGTL